MGLRGTLELSRYDPTTFVGFFGINSVIFGLGLLALPAERAPSLHIFSEVGAEPVSTTPWGFSMILIGVALFSTIFVRHLAYRAMVCIGCGAAWLYFGTYLILGGISIGMFSAAGSFGFLGGIGCLFAATQWIVASEPIDARKER